MQTICGSRSTFWPGIMGCLAYTLHYIHNEPRLSDDKQRRVKKPTGFKTPLPMTSQLCLFLNYCNANNLRCNKQLLLFLLPGFVPEKSPELDRRAHKTMESESLSLVSSPTVPLLWPPSPPPPRLCQEASIPMQLSPNYSGCYSHLAFVTSSTHRPSFLPLSDLSPNFR